MRMLDAGVALAGLCAALAGLAIWGLGRGAIGAAAAASLAFANWIAIRCLLGGLFAPGMRGTRRVVLALLVGLKVAGVVAALWALWSIVRLPAASLALGYSALAAGLLGGAALAARSARPAGAGAGASDA